MREAGERERAAVKNWLKERGATFQFTTWIVEPGQKYDQGEYISTEEAMVRYAEAARREERKRIQDDPGSQLFGRSLTEIRRALNFYDMHKRLEER